MDVGVSFINQFSLDGVLVASVTSDEKERQFKENSIFEICFRILQKRKLATVMHIIISLYNLNFLVFL